MSRPQNLLDVLETCIDNVLKLYEDLQVALIDGHPPDAAKVQIEFIEEKDRDPTAPMRLHFVPYFDTEAP
jgi:hypothetical protein